MNYKFREIFLSWRKEKGSRRKLVGVIKRTASSGITFKYLEPGCNEAKKEGFKGYPGFPLEFGIVYKETSLDIFTLRLTHLQRHDNKKSLAFWEATEVTDKFDLLALTQGWLPTDNFEFLCKFNPRKGFKFVTDIAGLSHIKIEKGVVSPGDILTYEFEKNERAKDGIAVKVFKGNIHLGYIKLIHENIFHKTRPNKLYLEVKEIDQNGYIRNIFIFVHSVFI